MAPHVPGKASPLSREIRNEERGPVIWCLRSKPRSAPLPSPLRSQRGPASGLGEKEAAGKGYLGVINIAKDS